MIPAMTGRTLLVAAELRLEVVTDVGVRLVTIVRTRTPDVAAEFASQYFSPH